MHGRPQNHPSRFTKTAPRVWSSTAVGLRTPALWMATGARHQLHRTGAPFASRMPKLHSTVVHSSSGLSSLCEPPYSRARARGLPPARQAAWLQASVPTCCHNSVFWCVESGPLSTPGGVSPHLEELGDPCWAAALGALGTWSAAG